MSSNKSSLISTITTNLLNDQSFELSVEYLKYLGYFLSNQSFTSHTVFRNYDIKRPEKILNGDSVKYENYMTLNAYLNYAIDSQKSFLYQDNNLDSLITSLANFTSKLWIIHPFESYNTRTISIFITKYLTKLLNHPVSYQIFLENFIYFRNALVLANYENPKLNISKNLTPLILFYQKLLQDPSIILDNDSLYIEKLFTYQPKKRILSLS